jgi:hypothetical protein
MIASLIEGTARGMPAGVTCTSWTRDAGMETTRDWILAAGVPMLDRGSSRPLPATAARLVELPGQRLSRRKIGNRSACPRTR